MAKETVKNYVFSPSAKTVTFTDYTSLLSERVLLVTDTTVGAILYQFNVTVGASISGNVLTLPSVPEGAQASDHLNVIYDNQRNDPIYSALAVTLADAIAGEDVTANRMVTESRYSYFAGPITASTTVKAAPGRFAGLVCNSSTSLVVTVWDSLTASGQEVIGPLALSAGQTLSIPGGSTPFGTGLYVQFVSGSGSVTPFGN